MVRRFTRSGNSLVESPERGAVVGIGVDVEHVAAEDRLQRPLHRMLGEQVGDLRYVGHERERAHLPEQPMQAVASCASVTDTRTPRRRRSRTNRCKLRSIAPYRGRRRARPLAKERASWPAGTGRAPEPTEAAGVGAP